MTYPTREGRAAEGQHVWRVEVVDEWAMASDSDQLRTTDEPLGTKEKFWVSAPDDSRYLFKYARVHESGRIMGEDWVEWVVHELATMLSIPTATVIPATHSNRRGVLSLSVLRPGDRLIHGNELLTRIDPSYDGRISRKNPRYTVEAVCAALDGVAAPASCQPPISTAFDVWAGYLILDAWVAGRDRHHENWAAIDHAGKLELAPSFDHGNALGFQEREECVQELAYSEESLARWARRGRSHHFCDDGVEGRPGLVHLASTALELASPGVREHWFGALAAVTNAQIQAVLGSVPPGYLSEVGRTFRTKLLHHNQERILHGD
ncbi:hypothetical protein ACFVVM_27265 [Nocardia sp. NPDC058176]|uniref:hypothetical protein n=1 Tax=Nocardia sp. NPDC058176 TaxID=3346368 RepID=UPI0036D95212